MKTSSSSRSRATSRSDFGWARLAVVLVTAPIAACSLLTDLSGLSGGADPAGGVEGGSEGGPSSEAGATPDSGAAPDAPFTCPADAIFCEDFEGSLAQWASTDEQMGSTCDATTTRPHRGAKSLRALAPFVQTGGTTVNQNQCYFHHVLPVQATGQLAIRAYLYLVGAGQSGSFGLPWLRDSSGTGCKTGSVDIGPADGKWQAVIHTDTVYHFVSSTEPVLFDRWSCVEWLLDLKANGHLTLSVDGTKVIDAPATFADGDPFCGYRALEVGVTGHKSTGDVEAYWDDIVVAPHPVGCN